MRTLGWSRLFRYVSPFIKSRNIIERKKNNIGHIISISSRLALLAPDEYIILYCRCKNKPHTQSNAHRYLSEIKNGSIIYYSVKYIFRTSSN